MENECEKCCDKAQRIKWLTAELELQQERYLKLKEENRLICEHREILTAKLDDKYLGIG